MTENNRDGSGVWIPPPPLWKKVTLPNGVEAETIEGWPKDPRYPVSAYFFPQTAGSERMETVE